MPMFARQQFDSIRRFSDFDWLQQRLGDRFRGVIVPPVPEKSVMAAKIQMSEEFLESVRVCTLLWALGGAF